MHRKNNFDFIRLLLASFVILAHSYALTGLPECDWICQAAHYQLSFSIIGVRGFFIISGYLIFQSFERSNTLADYYWKRILRLFPALFILLLLTVLLAPFVYESSVPYLQNKSVWTYVPNNLILFTRQYSIDGVFETNPFKSVINGSLWTIRYEFTFYALLSLLFLFKKNKQLLNTILVILFLCFAIASTFFFKETNKEGDVKYLLANFFHVGGFFMSGTILSVLNVGRVKHKNIILLLLILLSVIAIYFSVYNYIRFFTLPIIVIFFGVKETPVLCDIGNKIGDLSYGTYLYGFPVGQILMHFFKFSFLELTFYNLIISLGLGFLSWHLIEKRALKLKNRHKINILNRT